MTAKIRGPQIDAGTGANQLVQLDVSGNMPIVDGSAITSVNASTLNGSADTAFAKLSSSNTFTALQTITHTGDIALSIQDSDGGNNSIIELSPGGSTNFGGIINNFIGVGQEQLAISKRDGSGINAAIVRIFSSGGVTIENVSSPATMIISSAGAITFNSATNQSITSSDDHRFAKTATFNMVSTAGTTIDWALGNLFTCTAASLLTFNNPVGACDLILRLTNASASLPAAVLWSGGSEPAKTGVSIIRLMYDGAGNYYATQDTNFL